MVSREEGEYEDKKGKGLVPHFGGHITKTL